jgi:hypothetical protein
MTADLWMDGSKSEHYAFILGYMDGFISGYASAIPDFVDPANYNKPLTDGLSYVRVLELGRDQLTQLADVMTDLYRDPANHNIPAARLIWIAHDKIAGRDVTRALERARADAYADRPK